MRQLFAIAANTFRETIRDRILNTILVFALGLILASILLGQLSAGQDVKIITDLGLAALSFFGVIIAIFVGTSLVHKELDKRTIFVVLTKPVSRSTFLLGKQLGLMATLTVLVAAMGAAFLGLLAVLHVPIGLGIVQAIGFGWLELIVLTALAMLFSTFSTPVLCMLYTFALYVIGHNADTLKAIATKAVGPLHAAIMGAYYLLPNLTTFDLKNRAIYGYAASSGQVLWTVAYAMVYAGALFSISALVFRRREL